MSGIHHVELWVPDLARAEESWGWPLEALGWHSYQHWADSRSWRLDDTYIVERSPALVDRDGFEVELVAN